MGYEIKNVVSSNGVPAWGNKKQFIAVHYLGVDGQNHELYDGCGAHYYIYWDGTIYQRCSHDAVPWAVGTAGYYTQKHPQANNYNTISIEMCCHCDGDKTSAEDPYWYFTTETQEACVWLVQKLMKELNIPIDNVLRHWDIVNKICPAPYVKNNKYKTSWTWDEFKAKVAGKPVEKKAEETAEMYRVRKTWKDSKSQIGAFENLDNAKNVCPVGYSVFNSKGKAAYTNKATKGTQWYDFAELSEKDAAEKILQLAKTDYEKTGVLASVTAAQMILESGYVTTLLSRSNNCFGMKETLSNNDWEGSTWDGKSIVRILTKEEYKKGKITEEYANFRVYPCIEDSVADHSAYLLGVKNGSKKRYEGLKGCTDYKKAITIIKNGGYATDSQYVSKICNIIERFDLARYDKVKEQVKELVDEAKAKSTGKQYRVQCGSFNDINNARRMVEIMKSKGFDGVVKNFGTHIAQAGVFSNRYNADALAKKIKSTGLDVIVVEFS